MRRLAAVLLLGSCALLLTPGAAGVETVPGDPTPPEVRPDITGTQGLNGWYVTNVTVRWIVTDPESIILETEGCDTRTLSADTLGVTLRCRALSDGGETSVSKTFQLDRTAPTLVPDPEPNPNTNGWHREKPLTVKFPGTDATSGIESCTPDQSYTGSDTAGTPVPGFCTDKAGNRTDRTYTVKYDATAPTLAPDPDPNPNANGWHRQPLTIRFPGTDATSGIDSCTTDQPYTGTDTAGTPIDGFCTDKAGNRTDRTYTVKYDATAPTLVPDPEPNPNALGWHKEPLVVKFPGTDSTSGIDACTPDRNYSSPDTTNTPIDGFCTDKAGNRTDRTYTAKYDATAPTLVPDPEPNANGNGWHRQRPTIKFPGSDATSGINSCTPDQPYTGGETNDAPIAGFCTDKAGNRVDRVYTVRYDATNPQVTSKTPSRPPDANGWYNHALTVGFGGSDNLSGVDSCTTQAPYPGTDPTPDDANATVPGTCTDKAGNESPSSSFQLKYDATKPTATPSASPQPNQLGWHRVSLTVSFVGSDATSGPDQSSCTSPQGYSGPDTQGRDITGTCKDLAGNTSNPATYTVKYDATPPALTPDPEPNPNALGWHRQKPLTVKFPGTDATSGINTCTADQPYTGTDTTGTPIDGFCTDKAGNRTDRTYTVKYDATAPTLAPDPEPNPNALGWHRQPLTIKFPGTDATSQIDTCTPDRPYSSPDTTSIPIAGFCTDKAGNRTDATYTLKYDATAPTLVPDPEPNPNALGWHRQKPLTVKFPGSDATSGINSCTPDLPYTGDDTANTPIDGFCTDTAGNRTDRTYTVRFDATAPTLVPDPVPKPNASGWHREPLTVKFPGSDATSGIDSCTPDQPYTGPDTTNTTVTGSCTDKAGNTTAPKTYAVKYDATNPQVTGVSPPPDPTGWYTAPIVFSFAGSDTTSGLDACPDVTYDGPDSADAAVVGACLDKAGNVGTRPFPLKYDDTGPAVIPTAAREPDSNGWYNHSLSISFAGSDTASGFHSCSPQQSYEGPDSVFAVVTGTCRDNAGNVSLGSLAFKYDATAPQVAGASADRAPDGNGWYNHPLTVRFFGSDAISDIDGCSVVDYAGPNNPNASVAGSCRDRAGNPSGTGAFTLKYDSIAPSLAKLAVKAGNRSAVLSWKASPDTALVEIARTAGARGVATTVYRGTGRSFSDTGLVNGVRYRYTLTAYDEARNAATGSVVATPTAPLISPKAGATVTAPPRLAWRRDQKATYYNVQVWRRGRIYSSWPTGTSVQLKRAWTYSGRRYKLTPGRYRWYVWPGYGARAKKKFGPLIGSSSFVVRG